MPAYRLGSVIETNVDEVYSVLAPLDPEIVVVNDGSPDDTTAALERASISHPGLRVVTLEQNRGKGLALLSGFAVSTGDHVVFLDADLDLPPGQIPMLLARMGDHDVLVGLKRSGMAGGAYPFHRRILSRVFAMATGGVFRLPVAETQTGLKILRREVLETVAPHMRIDRYAFDIELLVRAHAAGFTMTDHPVTLGDTASDSPLRLSMMWNLARDTARIGWWRLTEQAFKQPNRQIRP